MEQNRAFEKISGHYEALILSRRLKPGDRLPAERDLQEEHGVGRGTVREAYRALEQKGLIERKKGGAAGAYVKAMDAESAVDALALMVRHGGVSMERINEFRLAVEVDMAGYAAMRATPEDIADLKTLCLQAEELIARGEQHSREFYRLDLAMHVRLAEMTDNPIFEWVVGMIYKNADDYAALLITEEETPRWAVDDWWALFRALETRDVMKARSLAQAHIARSNESSYRGAVKSGRLDLLGYPGAKKLR